ncbi:hypothetical protein [Carnobacterium maltaromaticum]|uniref:hypothetical protein n=1 Tax=Carnobacterium maltaromaticum TaxID=2751 RepID=UPI0012FBA219|nr:hypothetical protein [Carnobacterium maltaromaticum]
MNELLNYGFEHSVIKGALCFHISEKEDRYITELRIQPDNLNSVEIRIFKLRIGFVVVSEETIINNEEGIYSGVKKNYLTFKEKFPSINSVE